jgi:hypothetical protein
MGEMSFEADGTKVIQPNDLVKGEIYTILIDYTMDGTEVDQLYNLMVGIRDGYINPIKNGAIGW